jgi:hypothetical protein
MPISDIGRREGAPLHGHPSANAYECQQHLDFRTIQACPKDCLPGLRETELAANRQIGRLSWRMDYADF